MTRVLAASLLCLAACGGPSHEPDPTDLENLADAGPMSGADAAPGDAAVGNPAVITVVHPRPLVAGQAKAYFSAADGTLISETGFDATGHATCACPADTTVTVILPTGKHTLVATQPGDVVHVPGNWFWNQGSTAMQPLKIEAPMPEGASDAEAMVGVCTVDDLYFDEEEPVAIWDVSLEARCLDTEGKRGIFYATGESSKMVAVAASADVSAASPVELVWHPTVPGTLTLTNVTPGAEVYLNWAPRAPDSMFFTWQVTPHGFVDGSGQFSVDVARSPGFGPELGISTSITERPPGLYHRRSLQIGVPNEDDTLDVTQHLLPLIQPATVTAVAGGRLQFTWDAASARAESDAVQLLFYANQQFWVVTLPPTATQWVTPVLPIGALDDSVANVELTVLDLLQASSYAQVRTTLGLWARTATSVTGVTDVRSTSAREVTVAPPE